MGGHAITGAERIRGDMYERLKTLIHSILSKHLKRIGTPIERAEKSDYGDLDILHTGEFIGEFTTIKDLLNGVFNPKQIVVNTPVVSFSYEFEERVVQIDMIAVQPHEFDMAYTYFSHGDLGRIIGVFSHWYGLRYTHTGLWMPIDGKEYGLREGGSPYTSSQRLWDRRILLSRDPEKVLTYFDLAGLLNLNPKTETDVFRYIIGSRFYDSHMYFGDKLLAVTGNTLKGTNIRDNYKHFLEFAKGAPDGICKKLPDPVEYFGVCEAVLAAHEDIRRIATRRTKFSGNLLVELGVPQKAIGETIKHIRQICETKYGNMDTWLDCTDATKVLEFVKEILQKK